MTNSTTRDQPHRFSDEEHPTTLIAVPNETEWPRTRVRSAIFLDFDNVFGGLFAVDPAAALHFARSPQEWLERLAVFHSGKHRDFLIRKVYLNPNGSLAAANGDSGRILFRKFGPAFTAAGFEVVDCPSLTSAQKNAADIRIVLDVMDVISTTKVDEIVVASSDADFTPLMYRLRASDRRTLILSTNNASAAFRNTADAVIDNGRMLELVTGKSKGIHADEKHVDTALHFEPLVSAEVEPRGNELTAAPQPAEHGCALSSATGAARVREWSRHFPDDITVLCRTTNLPKIATEFWPRVLAEIASVSAELGTYSPLVMSKMVRNQLAERGVVIGRSVVDVIYHSLPMAGIETETSEGHTVEAYIEALVALHIERAEALGWILDDAQLGVVHAWLAGDGENNPPAETGAYGEADTPLTTMSDDTAAEAG